MRNWKPKTLKDYLPYEFTSQFDDIRAYKYKDVKVLREVDGCVKAWPGTHKNVLSWYILENGYSVGFNENPARGWSFPVVKFPEK